MDMLPIRPPGGDYIKPATSTANDGGSKSQSGYMPRGERKEKKDEIIVSAESKRLIGDDTIIVEESHIFEDFFSKIKNFISKLIKFVSQVLKRAFKFEKKPSADIPINLFAEK
jgi:hypothetical protein